MVAGFLYEGKWPPWSRHGSFLKGREFQQGVYWPRGLPFISLYPGGFGNYNIHPSTGNVWNHPDIDFIKLHILTIGLVLCAKHQLGRNGPSILPCLAGLLASNWLVMDPRLRPPSCGQSCPQRLARTRILCAVCCHRGRSVADALPFSPCARSANDAQSELVCEKLLCFRIRELLDS